MNANSMKRAASIAWDATRPMAAATAVWLACGPVASPAATGDAISREFSAFSNSLAPVAVVDGISRGFSVFAGDLSPVAASDAVAREFSVMAGGTPFVPPRDAVAREFSVLASVPPLVILDPTELDYREGDPPLLIDPSALVENPDSDNFGGGFLRVEILSGPAPGDTLFILETVGGGITLGPEGEVLYQEIPIGTVQGGVDGEALMAWLNGNATVEATRELIRTVAFANPTRFPAAGIRVTGFTLADPLSGEGPTSSRDIGVEPVNEAPVPGDDFIGAALDTPLVFDVAHLLANDMDPDGDASLVPAVPDAATARGGAVAIDDGVVTYTPPPGFTGVDRFSYTLADPFGGVGTAVVTVHVRAPDDPSVTVLEMGPRESGFALSLVGLPERSYEGFVSEDLSSWEPFALADSDETGRLEFLDAGAGDFPSRFYRFAFPGP